MKITMIISLRILLVASFLLLPGTQLRTAVAKLDCSASNGNDLPQNL
jgi:hypothetical protein